MRSQNASLLLEPGVVTARGEAALVRDSAPVLVRGRSSILPYQPVLAALCALHGQHGEADNLSHFLTTAAALRKRPTLVLLPAAPGDPQPSAEGFTGAVLVFEYMYRGRGLRLFSSSDWLGRRNVLGAQADRSRLAATACQVLLSKGAQIVSIAFHGKGEEETTSQYLGAGERSLVELQWSLLQRTMPLYLSLQPTYDQTLALIGQKTRANLRYYRRRVEATLGCTFFPQINWGVDEFVRFNQISAFAVDGSIAAARYASMATLKHPFLAGLQARDGRWLAVAMGWTRHNAIEIEWQMNRADLPEYSLATVLRSFLIEHAIAQGLERLYIEGGTQQALQNSFVKESVRDLTVMKKTLYAQGVKKYSQRMFPKDNWLGNILGNEDVEWRSGV